MPDRPDSDRLLDILDEIAMLAKMPDAPWAQIRGMRNRIVHGYFGIDSLAVWRTATEETPALRQTISQSGLT